MNTKTTFNLGDDTLPVILICLGLAFTTVVGVLDYTNTLMPLASWFGLRGFVGVPFAMLLTLFMIRLPVWVTPVPKWLDRVSQVVAAAITVYLLLALIVLVAACSAMIRAFV